MLRSFIPPVPRRAAGRFLLLLALLVAPGPGAQAGRVRYADPNGLGPYAVGHTLFEVSDPARGGRVLRTELWYPVDPEDAAGTPTFYDFQFFGLGILSEVAFEDARVSKRPFFPLVVFSHGSGGVSWQSIFLMERLASHGFVVAAPNHTGNTANDVIGNRSDTFDNIARNRPLDVSFLITHLIARSQQAGDPLYVHIDPYAIGVAGHSFGGFTALAVASGYENAAAGTDVPADPRVRAIAPIAPASSLLSDAELASIRIPVFLLSGTLDDVTPIDDQTTRPWALVPGGPVYRADVEGATHLHFANTCDIGQELLDFGVSVSQVEKLIGGYSASCLPPAYPIEEVKRIQSFYLTAFFRRHLHADPRFEDFLTDAYAAGNEPDVIWFRRDAPLEETP
jgi:predicted dienelactone hydrolase